MLGLVQQTFGNILYGPHGPLTSPMVQQGLLLFGSSKTAAAVLLVTPEPYHVPGLPKKFAGGQQVR